MTTPDEIGDEELVALYQKTHHEAWGSKDTYVSRRAMPSALRAVCRLGWEAHELIHAEKVAHFEQCMREADESFEALKSSIGAYHAIASIEAAFDFGKLRNKIIEGLPLDDFLARIEVANVIVDLIQEQLLTDKRLNSDEGVR